MTDEQIREYLRGRAQVTPPLDLVSEVAGAVANVPQVRPRWFAPLVRAFGAVAVAAAVVLVAVVVAEKQPTGGPDVSDSPAASHSAGASASSTPAPPSTSEPTALLLTPGGSVAIDAVDATGRWGTIIMTRGVDYGADVGDSNVGFGLQVFIEYQADRLPEAATFGAEDWSIVTADDDMPIGTRGRTPLATAPIQEALGTYRRGIDMFTTPTEGMLYWTLPAQAVDEDLVLVYQPPGVDSPFRIPLRSAGRAPSVVPSSSPDAVVWPRPEPVYVGKEGLPFTVLASDEADRLFGETDTCTNPDGGYTVSYPDSWYTNTRIGDVPACSWFSPILYDPVEGGPRPVEIAIEIRVFDGNVGFIWVDVYSEEITLDGFPARRYETGMTKDVATPTNTFQYDYLARLDDRDDGKKIWAFTGTEYGGTYELNKAVLDRIMASIDFGA